MKKTIAFSLCCLFVSAISGQEIRHYDLKVDFDVGQKRITVAGTVDIDFQGQDSIALVLWKYTDIHSIKVDNKNAEYSFDTAGKSPNQYIPDGGKLTLRNIEAQKQSVPVYFSYGCDMQNVSGWAKSFTDDWIELGYYTAWYPVHNESRAFTSEIEVSMDPGFQVSGSGMVSREGNNWVITHSWPVFDNVIIASPNLKTRKVGGDKIGLELVYTTFPEEDLDSVSMVCQEIYGFYSHILGKQEDAYLKYVFNPLEGRGGYSRSKFVSIKTSGSDRNLKSGLAHEMAHFWWNNAATSCWEDWLNESFAECSMLLFLRENDSEGNFNRLIMQYKEQTKETPPIWGIDRQGPEAYNALYFKGSLILMEFEKELGMDKFFDFLAAVANNHISNTADFLDLVENQVSAEYRAWFENKLKT